MIELLICLLMSITIVAASQHHGLTPKFWFLWVQVAWASFMDNLTSLWGRRKNRK